MIAGAFRLDPVMVHPSQQKQLYAPRKPLPRVSIARNGKAWSFNLRPVIAALSLGGFALLLTAYVGATAYLVYRDDLLGAAVSRQVAMQYDYEERIAALRSELDRVSSRHVIQSESVGTQLGVLLERQSEIERRQSTLDGLVGRARAAGVAVAIDATRLPRARPGAVAGAGSDASPDAPLAYAPLSSEAQDVIASTLIRTADEAVKIESSARPILSNVRGALDAAHQQQATALDVLSTATDNEAARLSDALLPIGIEGGEAEAEPQGGPYIPATGLHFVERAAILDRMLDDIDGLRRSAEAMPLVAPVSSGRISSRFGYRTDPFLHRPGFHAGLDFATGEGTAVRATAPGAVVSAGWKGGYGKVVEIRHAGGVSTRYGHLSAILVAAGETVQAGAVIGRVGSTGRSTGPHLHYETRRAGKAVNPTIYLAAGQAFAAGRTKPRALN